MDEKTIVNKIEPYLLKKNLILKTSLGRVLTIYGETYLESNYAI
ncbi:Holliday junction DNA helicase RuvB C-terminal domain-containing protein [Malacoplasma iowae]|nr:Holliday junction DNA helicase RuvB C-terminal domain-containing protein [Malacoplasma iowae]WPL40420.1 Holliday junction DNA helicase RuvB C-terminal domain-containing protein [Malacoplasma iowae]